MAASAEIQIGSNSCLRKGVTCGNVPELGGEYLDGMVVAVETPSLLVQPFSLISGPNLGGTTCRKS